MRVLHALSACILTFLTALSAHAAPSIAPSIAPEARLSVTVDIARARLTGTVEYSLGSSPVRVNAGGLTVTSIGAEPRSARVRQDAAEPGIYTVEGADTLSVDFEAAFGHGEMNPSNVGVAGNGISAEGVSLTGLWHPVLVDGAGDPVPVLYRLDALVSGGLVAMSEAESAEVVDEPGGWVRYRFTPPHPMGSVSLVAGDYIVLHTERAGVKIYGYFFADDREAGAEALVKAADFIEEYVGLVGPFPYKRFSVVENYLPTGYAMPTFTLLGRGVLQRSFIIDVSLGHEILHQWFGNSVGVDYATGNWSEGLVAYLADHRVREAEGEDIAHRKKLLVEFETSAGAEAGQPLSSFRSRTDLGTRALGYAKGAMVFHMLRRELGDEVFIEGARALYREHRHGRAGWADLRAAFEASSGQDLGWFFAQWVARPGRIAFTVEAPRTLLLGGSYRLAFVVRQQGEAYRFKLPVSVVLEDGSLVRETFGVANAVEYFEMELGRPAPAQAFFDDRYDLMRAMAEAEVPPVVSGVLGDEKRIVVIPDGSAEIEGAVQTAERLAGFADMLQARGFAVKNETAITEDEIRTSSLVLLGLQTRLGRRLFGARPPAEGDASPEGFMTVVLKNPVAPGHFVMAAHASDAEQTGLAARKVSHYGKYSILRFQSGLIVDKTEAASDRGMRIDLRAPTLGVRPSDAMGLGAILDELSDREIIYVGEGHTNYEHHKAQLDVIRLLHERGVDIAIGMEMFQRPYQQPLDDYIAGRVDEERFLRDTEYFSRWGYNYMLYREIIDYARREGIDVVALNQEKEVVSAVAAGGLDSLTDEQRARLPQDMDMSDASHRARLLHVFSLHSPPVGRQFENFYQAQVIWDEAMAHAVVGYMDAHPGRKMVVLAGRGHVEYGLGIPKRAHRLGGRPYAVLVYTDGQVLDPGMADYVLYSRELEAPEPPMLGVELEPAGGEGGGLGVRAVSSGSLAAGAGVAPGDVILEADGVPVREVTDLKIVLLHKHIGDQVYLVIRRHKGFFSGDETLHLEVDVR